MSFKTFFADNFQFDGVRETTNETIKICIKTIHITSSFVQILSASSKAWNFEYDFINLWSKYASIAFGMFDQRLPSFKKP